MSDKPEYSGQKLLNVIADMGLTQSEAISEVAALLAAMAEVITKQTGSLFELTLTAQDGEVTRIKVTKDAKDEPKIHE